MKIDKNQLNLKVIIIKPQTMKRLFCIIAAMAALFCTSAQAKTPKIKSSRHIVIAASNTPKEDKALADFICTGKNDERVINKAIEKLVYGGTVQLLDGDYYVDAFEQEDNSAICLGYNNGIARAIAITGTTENKSYNSMYGTVIHVSQAAYDAMDPEVTYRVFYGSRQKPEGDIMFKYTRVNNVSLENFYLMFPGCQKKFIGIDCRGFGNGYLRQIGIYTDQYFRDRYYHLKPLTPVEGNIGVYSVPQSNDDSSRIRFHTVDVGGLYMGIYCKGIDHLIMQDCSIARCVVGYVFDGPGHKTLTMINCADEGNTHLPKFLSRKGHLTCIDFNIERFNEAYIPDDPTGDDSHFATEEIPGAWHGFISYTMQGKAYGLDGFWAEGSGRNMKTVDLNTEASTWSW